MTRSCAISINRSRVLLLLFALILVGFGHSTLLRGQSSEQNGVTADSVERRNQALPRAYNPELKEATLIVYAAGDEEILAEEDVEFENDEVGDNTTITPTPDGSGNLDGEGFGERDIKKEKRILTLVMSVFAGAFGIIILTLLGLWIRDLVNVRTDIEKEQEKSFEMVLKGRIDYSLQKRRYELAKQAKEREEYELAQFESMRIQEELAKNEETLEQERIRAKHRLNQSIDWDWDRTREQEWGIARGAAAQKVPYRPDREGRAGSESMLGKGIAPGTGLLFGSSARKGMSEGVALVRARNEGRVQEEEGGGSASSITASNRMSENDGLQRKGVPRPPLHLRLPSHHRSGTTDSGPNIATPCTVIEVEGETPRRGLSNLSVDTTLGMHAPMATVLDLDELGDASDSYLPEKDSISLKDMELELEAAQTIFNAVPKRPTWSLLETSEALSENTTSTIDTPFCDAADSDETVCEAGSDDSLADEEMGAKPPRFSHIPTQSTVNEAKSEETISTPSHGLSSSHRRASLHLPPVIPVASPITSTPAATFAITQGSEGAPRRPPRPKYLSGQLPSLLIGAATTGAAASMPLPLLTSDVHMPPLASIAAPHYASLVAAENTGTEKSDVFFPPPSPMFQNQRLPPTPRTPGVSGAGAMPSRNMGGIMSLGRSSAFAAVRSATSYGSREAFSDAESDPIHRVVDALRAPVVESRSITNTKYHNTPAHVELHIRPRAVSAAGSSMGASVAGLSAHETSEGLHRAGMHRSKMSLSGPMQSFATLSAHSYSEGDAHSSHVEGGSSSVRTLSTLGSTLGGMNVVGRDIVAVMGSRGSEREKGR